MGAIEIEPLTDLQRAVLEFERQRFKYAGAKDQQALTLFGMQPTKYSAFLQRLITVPAAEVYDPELVRRLRRLRDRRRAHRREASESTAGRPLGKWSTGAVDG